MAEMTGDDADHFSLRHCPRPRVPHQGSWPGELPTFIAGSAGDPQRHRPLRALRKLSCPTAGFCKLFPLSLGLALHPFGVGMLCPWPASALSPSFYGQLIFTFPQEL